MKTFQTWLGMYPTGYPTGELNLDTRSAYFPAVETHNKSNGMRKKPSTCNIILVNVSALVQ